MAENDRFDLIAHKDTGQYKILGKATIADELKLTIPVDPIFKRNQFLIDGASCSTLSFELNGALSHLCHAYLHFDTLLLYKKDALDRSERLQMKDFASVLNREEKSTREYLKGLIDHGALIKPEKRRRFYVNPRFKIRGGYISSEEFDMLLKHEPLIKNCLDEDQFKRFKNWRIAKLMLTSLE